MMNGVIFSCRCARGDNDKKKGQTRRRSCFGGINKMFLSNFCFSEPVLINGRFESTTALSC